MSCEVSGEAKEKFMEHYKRRKDSFIALAKSSTDYASGTTILAKAAWNVITDARRNRRFLFGDLMGTDKSYEVLRRSCAEALFIFFIFYHYKLCYQDESLIFEYGTFGLPKSVSFSGEKQEQTFPIGDATRANTAILVGYNSKQKTKDKKRHDLRFLFALGGFILGAIVAFIT